LLLFLFQGLAHFLRALKVVLARENHES
jgi:hypothetical protein